MADVAIFKLWELDLLRPFLSTVEKILVTEQEYNDLKSLGEKQLIDIEEINTLVDAGSVEIVVPKQEEAQAETHTQGLEGGEMQAVAMYKSVGARFIISEDDYMRANSERLGVRVISLPDAIWYMAKKCAITRQRAEEALDRLEAEGWYTIEVIACIKQNLNGKLKPLTGKQREKFLRLAEKYDKMEISLSAAASKLEITPVEFLEHFTGSGHTLKYSVRDFRDSQRRLYSFLGDDYPPKK